MAGLSENKEKEVAYLASFSETLFHKGASLRACYNVIGTLKPNKNGIIRLVKA